MGLTVVKGNMIEDGTITDSNFTNTTITSADMALDPRDADNFSSGSVPTAQLGNVTATDISYIKNDAAFVGFKIAANGSLSKYNLLDQIVDGFETDSSLDGASYTRHTVTTAGTRSWTIPSGVTSIDYLIVAGGGGGGGSNSWQCAGGGAGGYRTGTLQVIS